MGNYRNLANGAEGVTESASALAAGKPVAPAVVDAVAAVEDFPFYKSVGYGGLPTENARWSWTRPIWTATRWRSAPWAILVDIAKPGTRGARAQPPAITACWSARAREWALSQGLSDKTMLTDRAMHNTTVSAAAKRWTRLSPYDGHDTVGHWPRSVGLDERRHLHQRPVYEKTRSPR